MTKTENYVNIGEIWRRALIEKGTGEILADEDEGDRIKYVKQSSLKGFEKVKENISIKRQEEIDEGQYDKWTIDNFFKGNILELKAIMKELDTYEKALLYTIAPYVGYEDCCIRHANGKELSVDDLVELSGMSRDKAFKVVKSLIDKDILYKGKNSKNVQYFVNPWLFSKGTRVNRVLKRMFKNYKIRTKNNVKWSDLKDDMPI